VDVLTDARPLAKGRPIIDEDSHSGRPRMLSQARPSIGVAGSVVTPYLSID
jgi:hypothetical protein